MRVETSILIAAPPEKIWPFLVEPEKILKWCITFKKFEYTGEQRSGVGMPFYVEEKAGPMPLMRLNFKIREWGGLYKNKKLTWNNQMFAGTWYHVVMVINRDNDTVKVWVNGQRISGRITLTQGSFICAGRNDLTLGGSEEVAFDEVYVFTKSLTEVEIRDLYELVIVTGLTAALQ